jgi:hypothetical protein
MDNPNFYHGPKADTLITTMDYEVDANLIAAMMRENQLIPGAQAIPVGERWGVFVPHSAEVAQRLPSLMHYAAGAVDAMARASGRKGGDGK